MTTPNASTTPFLRPAFSASGLVGFDLASATEYSIPKNYEPEFSLFFLRNKVFQTLPQAATHLGLFHPTAMGEDLYYTLPCAYKRLPHQPDPGADPYYYNVRVRGTLGIKDNHRGETSAALFHDVKICVKDGGNDISRREFQSVPSNTTGLKMGPLLLRLKEDHPGDSLPLYIRESKSENWGVSSTGVTHRQRHKRFYYSEELGVAAHVDVNLDRLVASTARMLDDKGKVILSPHRLEGEIEVTKIYSTRSNLSAQEVIKLSIAIAKELERKFRDFYAAELYVSPLNKTEFMDDFSRQMTGGQGITMPVNVYTSAVHAKAFYVMAREFVDRQPPLSTHQNIDKRRKRAEQKRLGIAD